MWGWNLWRSKIFFESLLISCCENWTFSYSYLELLYKWEEKLIEVSMNTFYLHKKVLILRESKMRGWSQFTECSVSYSWIRNCALSSASYNSLYEFQILSLLDLGGEFIIVKCERPFFYFIIAANWDRWHAARLPGISEEACKSSKNTEKKWQREKRKTCTLP